MDKYPTLGTIAFLSLPSFVIYVVVKDFLGIIKYLKSKWYKYFIAPKELKEEIALFKKDADIFNNLLINYAFSACTKCSDSNHEIIEVNKSGTSIRIKCETCRKSHWIKPFKDDYDHDELNRTFHSYRRLLYHESYLLNLEYDSIERKTEQEERHISQYVKDKVWNRDGGKCVECGSKVKLEFDHIIPYSKGGANTYRNIQLLCETCNRKKSANIG